MRGSFKPLLLALTVLIVGAIGVQFASAQPVARAASSSVLASGSEYRISLSRTTVKPGQVRVEFDNFGEDDHDLAITRKGGGSTRQLSTVRPDQQGTLSVKLRRGSYVLWCTISDHKARGMRAVLKVKD